MRRLIRWMVAVMLLALVATACSQQRPAQQQQLAQTLDTLSTNVQQLQEETTYLHDSVHQLEERVNTLEAATGQLSLDAGGIGPSRAQFLPDPPDGQVTVQLLARDENNAIPGEFTFHLAPDGAELFETRSLAEGETEELAVGPEIENGIAFVEPGKFYRLQVVYRNPTDEEMRFLVRGGLLDPKAALPFVRNRCWCAAIPFSAPAGGTFSRIIDVGVGPDTPPGAKAIVVWPVVRLTQEGG